MRANFETENLAVLEHLPTHTEIVTWAIGKTISEMVSVFTHSITVISTVGTGRTGKPHGHGVSSLSNRSKYVGNHEDGNRHGEGIFYAADGTVEASGMWKDNQLIKSYVLDTTQFPNNQLR